MPNVSLRRQITPSQHQIAPENAMKAIALVAVTLALTGMLTGCSTAGPSVASQPHDEESFHRSIHERMNDLQRRQLEQDHRRRVERSLESRRPAVTSQASSGSH